VWGGRRMFWCSEPVQYSTVRCPVLTVLCSLSWPETEGALEVAGKGGHLCRSRSPGSHVRRENIPEYYRMTVQYSADLRWGGLGVGEQGGQWCRERSPDLSRPSPQRVTHPLPLLLQRDPLPSAVTVSQY